MCDLTPHISEGNYCWGEYKENERKFWNWK